MWFTHWCWTYFKFCSLLYQLLFSLHQPRRLVSSPLIILDRRSQVSANGAVLISHSLIVFNASVLFYNIYLLFQHHMVSLEAPQICLVRAPLVNRMSLFPSVSYFIISKFLPYFLIKCFLHFKLKLYILHYLSFILVFNINFAHFLSSSVATQSNMVMQPAPITNPFGTLPAMPQMSIGRVGSAPSVQYGISSMPVSLTSFQLLV